MLTYIQLVNKLRDRLNEVNLIELSTWSTAVGFDQYSKDAINYAYKDIINAEMEWPFLHQNADLKTVPGDQFYTPTLTPPTGFLSPAELKEIDWESFYIKPNETQVVVTDEIAVPESATPYSATTVFATSWAVDGGAKTFADVPLTPVSGDPLSGQYTVRSGVYYFNANMAGLSVKITYTYANPPTQASQINPLPLSYIDYDLWREGYLIVDLGGMQANNRLPRYVFKTQKYGEIGITPIPDKIYTINFEYWLDPLDLSATTDVPLLPTRFQQIILDGAQKYCYEFREDPQLAAAADKRFMAGIARMRIELINKASTMRSGMYWRRNGGYYISTPAPR